MVSDFRRKKLLRGFKSLDTDKSGNIEKADFDMALERSRKARGWQESDAKYQELAAFMNRFWEGVQTEADADNDGKVTEEEWLKMWDDYSKSPGTKNWQKDFAEYVFKSIDDGDDGSIDHKDFITALTATGERKKEDVEAAWVKVSKGKATITLPEFEVLWMEYFTTEDPNAPGNFIFGAAN